MSITLESLAKYDFCKSPRKAFGFPEYGYPFRLITGKEVYVAVSDRYRVLTTARASIHKTKFTHESNQNGVALHSVFPSEFQSNFKIEISNEKLKILKSFLKIQKIENSINKTVILNFDFENSNLQIKNSLSSYDLNWDIDFKISGFDGDPTNYEQSFNLEYLVEFFDFIKNNYKNQDLIIKFEVNRGKPILLSYEPEGVTDDRILYLVSPLRSYSQTKPF